MFDILAFIGTHKDGDTLGNKWDTPQEMYVNMRAELQRFPDDDPLFIVHQLAGWTNDPIAECEMSASEFYAVPREIREAFVRAVQDARWERPDLRIGLYGSLNIGSPYTVNEPKMLYDPNDETHRRAMLTLNIRMWQNALGDLAYAIDNGGAGEKRYTSVILAHQLHLLHVPALVEGIPVTWADNPRRPTGLDAAMLEYVWGMSDAKPWSHWWRDLEIPEAVGTCYVYLHRLLNDGTEPTSLGHDYYRSMVAKGYRLGCDSRYDGFVLECLA